MKVYLDNAATTPLDKEVIVAMLPYMEKNFGNPSSIHSFGREAKSAIEGARKTVAKLLNVSPSEIFFTSGGTEANNMAIRCSIRDLGITHCITSPLEHHAVLNTMEEMEKQGKVKLSFVRIKPNGHIDLAHLEELLTANPHSLVSLMHANNELGNLLPIKEVNELCKKFNAVFHSDTVQTMGHYKFDFQKINLDFASCAAHKFHGPKGVGFVYINSNVRIHPFIYGGAQERNMRGGTENVYGIVGLAKAFEIAHNRMEEDQQYIAGLKQYMTDKLRNHISGVEFNGDTTGKALYTVLNVSFPSTDINEMLLFNLDIAGVAVSGGSACSSGSDVGSHVLKAINADPDRPSVRFSFSRYNTKEEIDFALDKLRELFEVKV